MSISRPPDPQGCDDSQDFLGIRGVGGGGEGKQILCIGSCQCLHLHPSPGHLGSEFSGHGDYAQQPSSVRLVHLCVCTYVCCMYVYLCVHVYIYVFVCVHVYVLCVYDKCVCMCG